jgi:hypothetical protein
MVISRLEIKVNWLEAIVACRVFKLRLPIFQAQKPPGPGALAIANSVIFLKNSGQPK